MSGMSRRVSCLWWRASIDLRGIEGHSMLHRPIAPYARPARWKHVTPPCLCLSLSVYVQLYLSVSLPRDLSLFMSSLNVYVSVSVGLYICLCLSMSVWLSLILVAFVRVSSRILLILCMFALTSLYLFLLLSIYMCTIAPPYASCLPLYPTLLLSKLSISFDLYFPPSLNRNFHKIFMKCSLSLTSASFPPSPLCPIFTSASLSVFLIFDMTSHPLSRLEYSIAGRRHAWRQSDADVAALCSPRAWCFPVFSFLEFSRF